MRKHSGGGPSKIQHSEVLACCVFEEISGQERRDLLYVVRMLDNVWWDLTQKKSESDDDGT